MPFSSAIWLLKGFRLLGGVTAGTLLRETSILWTNTAVFFLYYYFLMPSNAITLWDDLWKQIRSVIDSIKHLICTQHIFYCQICLKSELLHEHRSSFLMWIHIKDILSFTAGVYLFILGNIFWHLPTGLKTSPSCKALIIFHLLRIT